MTARRILVALAALPLLAACGSWRHVERDVVTIDGERFLCSVTVNEFSGNESHGQCAPLGEAP